MEDKLEAIEIALRQIYTAAISLAEKHNDQEIVFVLKSNLRDFEEEINKSLKAFLVCLNDEIQEQQETYKQKIIMRAD